MELRDLFEDGFDEYLLWDGDKDYFFCFTFDERHNLPLRQDFSLWSIEKVDGGGDISSRDDSPTVSSFRPP